MATSRSTLWVDASGKRTITRIRTGTGATALQAAMLTATNADFSQWWESAETTNAAPAPVAAVYQGVQPQAQLQFIALDNTLATLLLPAPKTSIFLADKETVDPASAPILAIIAAAIATGGLVSASGSPVSGLIGGKLLPYRGAP